MREVQKNIRLDDAGFGGCVLVSESSKIDDITHEKAFSIHLSNPP